MKQYILTILFVVSSTLGLFAQQKTVKGQVVETNNNRPIYEASITVKGTTNFTTTDREGRFKINMNDKDVLEIQHLSYNTKEVEVDSDNIVIALDVKLIFLDDIIIQSDALRDISQSTVVVDNIKSTTQPRNVGDLFRDIKGFGVQKRGAYASEPFFRAFKYEQLNIQLDGGMKIQNACPSRMDPITTHIISDEIERIEIVRGPFTVRFGQNFGGIINMVSKNPNTLPKGIHGGVTMSYEANGENLSTTGNITYRSDKFDLTLNGEYRNYGDYKDGNGTKVTSSFRTTDYSALLGYNPTEQQRLQISWRQSFGRDIDHAGLMMDSPYDDSFLAGIDYRISDVSDFINSISAKAFYSEVDHLMTNENRPSFAMTDAASEVFASTYGGKMEVVLSPNNDLFIFTGVDADIIEREGDRIRIVKMMNGNPLPTPRVFTDKIWQDSKLSDIGVFAEAKYRLSHLYTLTAGLRTDFAKAIINDPEQDFLDLYGGRINSVNETNVSGNLSVRYQNGSSQVQLALGRGVRTASMIERFINHFAVGVDPYEYVGNPYLKPEVNNQVELSYAKKLSQIEFGASVFYSLIEDYIVPIVDENIPRKFMPNTEPTHAKRFVNVDKAMQTGFELYWNYNITHDLKFSSDFSYTYAKNKDYDEPLAQITPFTTNLALKYERDTYWLNLNSRFVAAQKRVSESFRETASEDFTTLDFSVGYTPTKNLTIGASILNIFDTAYYEHLNFSYQNSDILSGRIYEPGRNFTVRINYSF